jgi:ribose transport system substrate-binding protein
MAAQMLLESGEKPGSRNLEFYTQPLWIDKTNASGGNCYALPKK